jgi:hypothetical protein
MYWDELDWEDIEADEFCIEEVIIWEISIKLVKEWIKCKNVSRYVEWFENKL